ncbi:spore-associated protein A [Streptomyces parvus]|uniref:spore-associated protein A n=1 Tax=Streptomyces parvus TaxID=66428 RepID=UPI0033FD2C65
MKSKLARRAIAGTSALAGILGLGIAAAPAANAAAAYNGACGSGYAVVNSMAIGTKGMTYLTYNSSTGKNCAVTIRNTPGAATRMIVLINVTGTDRTVVDDATYTTYAGPVYINASGSCVTWVGNLLGASNSKIGTNCG